MNLSIAYSPCPNDTFIFDALAHQKIDTEGLTFDIIHGDVETLNREAMDGKYDITKLSYHAFAYMSNQYQLLTAGSALGRGCGPLMISKDEIPRSKIEFCLIGIPGRLTTANFLMTLAFPEAATKKEMVFNEIENALLNDAIDIGLIIHENRFTYIHKGLKKIIDLGEWWEKKYQLPIPLGGIVTRRDFEPELQLKINRVVKRSVEFALANPAQTMQYVRDHAQEMDEQVMQQHIALYVNDFSVDLGEEGKAAISALYEVAAEKKIIPGMHYPLFVD
ncbi:MAG: 1,4-dihydroxy-6-naphthoate synthase [Chitinophagales bacterium]|jgi:1,4-dihydroxy-6-naphthoate synthase|nr:1,4-dihydroxy-6-naphthoate synthase [Bacteroidota bacterium]MBK9557550.1 1,4-dihydroxy-6-naphthoate synthase [Bacteroidota bacterium]MBL0282276.1 1,4-dihydroxy-6-naphthoate synthase [Bacteroidota bacterium]MBP9880481.1 1,4-dihydroxy-6-naphthoate synthase [Chitinophagales bacterium]